MPLPSASFFSKGKRKPGRRAENRRAAKDIKPPRLGAVRWDLGQASFEAPECTRCEKPMAGRTRKSDGSRFWGCSRFPLCKATKPYATPKTATT